MIADKQGKKIGLWGLIREDWTVHARDWRKPGFRAIAVHRFGVWRMGIRPRVLRMPLSALYGILFRHVRNVYGIELPYTVKLGRRVVIEHQGCIIIGSLATIGDRAPQVSEIASPRSLGSSAM